MLIFHTFSQTNYSMKRTPKAGLLILKVHGLFHLFLFSYFFYISFALVNTGIIPNCKANCWGKRCWLWLSQQNTNVIWIRFPKSRNGFGLIFLIYLMCFTQFYANSTQKACRNCFIRLKRFHRNKFQNWILQLTQKLQKFFDTLNKSFLKRYEQNYCHEDWLCGK